MQKNIIHKLFGNAFKINKLSCFFSLFLLLSEEAFAKEDVIIKSSNTVIDCNGGLFNEGKVTYLLIKSKKVSTGWEQTKNVTIKNCTIRGGIRIMGLGRNGQDAEVKSSSLSLGHTERAQAVDPSNIKLSNVVIEAHEGLTLLYAAPGTTYLTVENCVFQGGNTGKGPIVYLDAESAHNVFRHNIFNAKATREIIACDGSAYNLFESNTFQILTKGGIYLYRNCGEGGAVRHQTPHHNIIKNNIFNLKNLVLNFYSGKNYGVWLGARNGNRKYCEDDSGYSFGSSIDNRDFADENRVENNTFLHQEKKWYVNDSGANNVIYHDSLTSIANGGGEMEKISLFPNPAESYIVLFGFTQSSDIGIFSLSGEKLKAMEVLPNQVVDLSDLPQGIYFARIENRFIKFVKQ